MKGSHVESRMRYRMLLLTPPALGLILGLSGCGSKQGVTGSGAARPADLSTSPAPSTTSNTPTGAPTDPATATPTGRPGRPAQAPLGRLTITAKASPQAAARTVTLICEPAGGTHPAPAAACARLTGLKDPFKAPPAMRMCTKIYGGPQVATVRGTWRGGPVRARFTRADGCEVSRWNGMGPALARLVPAD